MRGGFFVCGPETEGAAKTAETAGTTKTAGRAEEGAKRGGKEADRRSRMQTNIPEADKQEKTANGEEGGGRVRDKKQRRREALKNSDVSDATHTSLTPPNRFPIGKVRQNGIGILPRSVFRDKDNKKINSTILK